MTFYVEKADGTCVGADCSTYLTDWADGSGSSMYWAANITPSLNSQVKAGQHWTMTIQNAGLGYNGYLSSPSGQGLPAASGSTPAGAQFKLMTQNEINDQPPWAVALEEFAGEAIALVGLSVLTAGAVDAAFAGAEVVDDTVDSVTVANRVGTNTVTETVTVDSSAIQAASAEAGQPPMAWGRRVARRAVMSEGWWQPEGADDMGHDAYRRLIKANWNPWDGIR
jgi:hypothetical protein